MLYVQKDGFREPYSRWKLTESITAAGLDSHRAYKISIVIQEKLKKERGKSIKEDDIRDTVHKYLLDIDSSLAERYIIWSQIRRKKIPVVMLIGGPTGIGKSSIALEFAHRMGIKQVIGTDTIREIMKNVIAPNLIPSVHYSSFEAWKTISHSVKEDKVIVGFREQAKVVSIGINAAIERSLKEGISLIIEGVHIVPEFVLINSNVVPIMLCLDDVEVHKSRFVSRASATHVRRDAHHYTDSMGPIHTIQDYLKESAKNAGVPIIENVDFGKTIVQILDVAAQRMKKLVK